jgi:ribosomal protein S17E
MALSEKAKNGINKDIEQDLETVQDKYKEQFKAIALEVITSYNERITNRLDKFCEEVSPFMTAELPMNPKLVREAMEINSKKIRDILTSINELLSPIGNPAIKILFVDTLKDGLGYLKESSVETVIKLDRMVGKKVN